MKSTLSLNNSPNPKPFPNLYLHKNSGYVVLFISATKGTVVKSQTSLAPLGYVSDQWPSCFENEWTKLSPGDKVILEAE